MIYCPRNYSFMEKGFTDYQAKLMTIWEDKRIASICSQMPNLIIMAANAVAALDRKGLSASDRTLLVRYAQETCGDYCAGCGRFCLQTVHNRVPVNDIMRCLMYARSYQDFMLARSTFHMLPEETQPLLNRLDFRAAERSCPRNLPIGRLMKEATTLFA